ncbi:MAG: hypothetical protein ACLKAK_01200 [Alkaliphilus sp.]
MSLPIAFYCHPNKAKELGYTIKKTFELSNSDAIALRNQYELMELGHGVSITIVAGILAAGLKSITLVIGFVISSTLASAITYDHLQSLDNDFDKIATSGSKFQNVEYTYMTAPQFKAYLSKTC